MSEHIIKFDLYNNAMDSFQVSIDAFIRGEYLPTYYKVSIKEMFAAFELILKDILKDEHEAFIYTNVEHISEPIEKRRTIKFDTLIERLEKLADFTLEDRYLRVIKRLRTLRNMGQHSTFEVNKQNAADLISKSVPIMIHIIKEYYDEDINLEDLLGEHYSKAYVDISTAVEALNKDALNRFNEDGCKKIIIGKRIIKCIFCNSELISDDGDNVKCYCCHKEFKVEDFYLLYAENDSELNDDAYECGACNHTTMFEYLPLQQLICLRCGHMESFRECCNCNKLYPMSQLNDETDFFGIKPPDKSIYICDACKKEREFREF